MEQVIIKKTSQQESTQQRPPNILHYFLVNNKSVKVYENWNESNDYPEAWEQDVYVDQKDLATLTDIEHEVFGEDLNSWIALKVNEVETVEY